MKELKILLVEDDIDHADLITEVLETNGIRKEIILLKNGQEAIDYFQEGYVNTVEEMQDEVGLIILDLKLPKIDGMGVLKFLKKNPKYCSIPVVIFSTTSEIRVIAEGYRHGVNSFITKPISYERFVEKMKVLKEYWLRTCALPIHN
ncbi:MAG: response regulator [Candidatus Scalindua sp.]